MERDKQRLGLKIGPMLTAFGRIMKTHIKQEGMGYTLEHLVLLNKISCTSDVIVQQDIAEWMSKDKSAILRFVDVLEKDGLLIRKCDPQDRRRNILQVTSSGKKLIGQLNDIEATISATLLQDIPEDELELFFSVADRIKYYAERINSELSK